MNPEQQAIYDALVAQLGAVKAQIVYDRIMASSNIGQEVTSPLAGGETWTLLLDIDYNDVNNYVIENAPAGSEIQFAPTAVDGYIEKIMIYRHTGFSRPDPSKDFYATSITSMTQNAITPLYTFNVNLKTAYPFADSRHVFLLDNNGADVTGANAVADYFTFTGPDAPFPGDWTVGRVQIYGVIKSFPA